MRIQRLLFDYEMEYGPKELYIRGENITVKNGILTIKKDTTVTLDTYFNMFSSGKWRKYTNVDNVSVRLLLSGRGTVKLICITGEDSFDEHEVSAYFFDSIDKWSTVVFENIPIKGLGNFCYLKIEAQKTVNIKNGAYFCESRKGFREIHLACGICTYKREKEVERTVHMLMDAMKEDIDSPLDNIEIFISDNGHTLSQELFSDAQDRIHLFWNKNYGGSAGFTRTIIEAVLCEKKPRFTHMLLMDDDALILPSVIERTICLLQFLKSEYQDHMLGGALMSLKESGIQIVKGELFLKQKTVRYKAGWDMRKKENIIRNEDEETVNYNGWWYTCIPTTFITPDNLPLPLFLHKDDVEYGMRCKAGFILLNGCCAWHDDPLTRERTYIYYYNNRNGMILATKYESEMTAKQVCLRLLRRILINILNYHYEKAWYVLRGFEDFYRGIDWFIQQDAENLNNSLLKYKKPKTCEVSGVSLREPDTKCNKWIQYLRRVFNYLVPNVKGIIYYDNSTKEEQMNLLGVKTVCIVDSNTGIGELYSKSRWEALKLLWKFWKLKRHILKKHDRIFQEWGFRCHELETKSFWEKYLEL